MTPSLLPVPALLSLAMLLIACANKGAPAALPAEEAPDVAAPAADTDTGLGADPAPVDEVEEEEEADLDEDGVVDALDCAPADPLRHAGAAEACDFIDNNCDGAVDNVAHTLLVHLTDAATGAEEHQRFTFDAAGRLVWSGTQGASPEGPWQVESTATYDALGLRAETSSVDGDPTTLEYTAAYDRDAEGRLVEMRADWDGDGLEEYHHDCSYESDGSATCRYYGVSDEGLEYVWNEVRYDAQGELVEFGYDYDADAVMEELHQITVLYDGDNEVIARELDLWANGLVDQRQELDWLNGQRVAYRFDAEADGAWDSVEEAAYTEQGELRMEAVTAPTDSLRRQELDRDLHGRLEAIRLDYGTDGLLEATHSFTRPTDAQEIEAVVDLTGMASDTTAVRDCLP